MSDSSWVICLFARVRLESITFRALVSLSNIRCAIALPMGVAPEDLVDFRGSGRDSTLSQVFKYTTYNFRKCVSYPFYREFLRRMLGMAGLLTRQYRDQLGALGHEPYHPTSDSSPRARVRKLDHSTQAIFEVSQSQTELLRVPDAYVGIFITPVGTA